jgi:geranylgeranyl diphosphate synthase type I
MTLETSQPQDTENHVAGILQRCRQLVDPALREAISQLHPRLRLMATFTFGWCEADGAPREGRSGKALRPAIVLLSARAVGAPPATAVHGAVAVELVHAFSLVHDDIMDGDERRRHRQTVWKAYGVRPAVLTGNTLLALAMDTLAHADAPHTAAAVRQLTSALMGLLRGQAEDVALESRPWNGPAAVTTEEYHTMAAGKTGALLSCAAAIGTLLGGGPPSATTAMSRVGRHLGLAFQAIDDLLGIWGDPEVTGKPIFSDLRAGKKTLPVVAAMAHGADRAPRLAELLGARLDDDRTLRQAAELIRELGGLAYTRQQADLHLNHALRILETEELERTAARELAALSRFLVHRTH